MNKTVTIVSALAVGVAVGVAVGGRLMNPADASDTADLVQCRAGCRWRTGCLRPLRGAAGVAEGSHHAPGPRQVDLWIGARHLRRKPEPRVSCSAAPSCRPCGVRRRKCIPRSVRACNCPFRVCRGATPTPLLRPAPEGRARIRRRAWKCGGARRRLTASWASMRAGTTPSLSSTARGNITEDWTQWDDKFKRPHAVYISPYDAQKSTSGSSTITRTRSTSSPTTASRLVQTIGTPNVRVPMARIQPADLHGLDAERRFLRLRRLQRHARREV